MDLIVSFTTNEFDILLRQIDQHQAAVNSNRASSKGQQPTFPNSEPVSQAIRDHQTGLNDWPYAELASELHRWVEIYDVEFKLNLPSYPTIKFARLRSAYANYRWSRDEIGVKDDITFNVNKLDRDLALILRTLLHELLHLWQHYHGKPGKSNYHNVEFRKKALECGLTVDQWGCTSGHNETFTEAMSHHNIQIEPSEAEVRLWGSRGREQKMKKWSCRCTNVRCYTKLQAKCLKCGEHFGLA